MSQEPDPHYDPADRHLQVVHRGHRQCLGGHEREGVTIYFDPDNHEVLGFTDPELRGVLQGQCGRERGVRGDLPAKVPAHLAEEMDFDAEMLKSGVRIAEFY